MESAITCPKCNVAMIKRVAAPRPGARTITADYCDQCASMFFDEHELAEVSRALSRIPFRVAGAKDAVSPNPRLPQCPKCKASGANGPVEVKVLDVAVDFCLNCHGVMLDGGEYEALARATALDEAGSQVSSYRAAPNAARAAQKGVFRCSGCGDEAKTSESMIVPAGLVCGTCYYAREETELKRDKNYGSMRDEIMRDRFAGPKLDASENGDGLGAGGVAASVVLGGLSAMLDVGPKFCQWCGHRRGAAGCTHY